MLYFDDESLLQSFLESKDHCNLLTSSLVTNNDMEMPIKAQNTSAKYDCSADRLRAVRALVCLRKNFR